MQLIDSHSHIFSQEFDSDREGAMQRAREQQVVAQLLPNIDSTTTRRLLQTSDRYSGCFPLMGLHPTSVRKDNLEHELAHVEQMLREHSFYGIGEIGIDLYWDNTFIEEQKEAFRFQLQLAKKYGLPVSIHSRNSFEEIFQVIDSVHTSDLFGVFHSFTGTLSQYQRIAQYGTFLIGIGGIVTYKNGGVANLLPDIPLEHILLETDSPYLSPVPVRGRRNEPGNLRYIAQKVAELKDTSPEEVARITAENTLKLFRLPRIADE